MYVISYDYGCIIGKMMILPHWTITKRNKLHKLSKIVKVIVVSWEVREVTDTTVRGTPCRLTRRPSGTVTSLECRSVVNRFSKIILRVTRLKDAYTKRCLQDRTRLYECTCSQKTNEQHCIINSTGFFLFFYFFGIKVTTVSDVEKWCKDFYDNGKNAFLTSSFVARYL